MKKKNISLILLVAVLLVSVVFVSGCYQTDGDESTTEGGDWTWIIFLVVIFAGFYFLMIWPQRRKQKEHQKLIDQLQKGDNVVTAGGIYGVVESVSEDSVVIKVQSGATMRVAKGSVAIKQER